MRVKSEINVEKNYTKISNEFFDGLTLDEIGLMSYLQHLSTRKFAVSSLADIATKFSIDKTTLIRIIGRLEKKGFLVKSGERYNKEYCLKIGSDSCKNQPKDSCKNQPKDSCKNQPKDSCKNQPIVRTKVKEKEVKEKEDTQGGLEYIPNKGTKDLSDDQIKTILIELGVGDKVEKINGNLYSVYGEDRFYSLGRDTLSILVSYINLNPCERENNIRDFLKNPNSFYSTMLKKVG